MSEHDSLRLRRSALVEEWSRWVPRLSTGAGSSHASAGALRAEITESWRRSLVSVDPERGSAPASAGGEALDRWTGSPLRGPLTELAGEFRSIAEDAGFVTAVTDESGTILWTCGGRTMRRRAERVNFAPGGCWDEQAMGTNALSLALHTGRPSTVFSAEHLVATLHDWVCYCAPVHAPDGRILGVVDISTTWDRSHPLSMTMVRSLVSRIEAELRTGRLPAHGPRVRVHCLGTGGAERAGTPLSLRPRQLEILTLLALEPEGFTPGRLREAVYGDRPISTSTFKAEVSHLRHALGGGIANRRYTLTSPLSCDAVDVLRALECGDTTTTLRFYRGPLLPFSEAPGITEWRAHLEVAVREAALTSSDPEYAFRYGERGSYDTEIHQRALRLLNPGDSRRPLVVSRSPHPCPNLPPAPEPRRAVGGVLVCPGNRGIHARLPPGGTGSDAGLMNRTSGARGFFSRVWRVS
ncbi:helix-turn-helix domain-containing protein [Actinomadura welshii]|uniref:helix-turn-helix domain-containing protein n=1 Tax=Actinomadura welshii TaxID=3103817 RepID=UPI0004631818|nr:helix-turn-helix domain-containing protein [Actinomadura madurae]